MKVLTIQQPWASLVVQGHKKIETRSWATKYRGPLLVHASAGTAYKKLPHDDPMYLHYYPLFAHGKIPPIEQLPFGAIIGQVNLVNVCPVELLTTADMCCMCDFTEQERAFGDYTPGRFGWLLSDPVLFDEPIPAKGQLNLWNYDGPLPAAVTFQNQQP